MTKVKRTDTSSPMSDGNNATTTVAEYGTTADVAASTSKTDVSMQASERVSPPIVMAEKPLLTEAQKIWLEIRDKTAPMFGLPNQKLGDYLQFHPLNPNKCYLIAKASSVLPMLEEVFKDKFEFDTVSRYIVATRKVSNE